jgi:hypothetical protein
LTPLTTHLLLRALEISDATLNNFKVAYLSKRGSQIVAVVTHRLLRVTQQTSGVSRAPTANQLAWPPRRQFHGPRWSPRSLDLLQPPASEQAVTLLAPCSMSLSPGGSLLQDLIDFITLSLQKVMRGRWGTYACALPSFSFWGWAGLGPRPFPVVSCGGAVGPVRQALPPLSSLRGVVRGAVPGYFLLRLSPVQRTCAPLRSCITRKKKQKKRRKRCL